MQGSPKTKIAYCPAATPYLSTRTHRSSPLWRYHNLHEIAYRWTSSDQDIKAFIEVSHSHCHYLKMEAPPPPPPQWVLDLNSPPQAKQKSSGIPDPIGFTSTSNKVHTFFIHSLLYRFSLTSPRNNLPPPRKPFAPHLPTPKWTSSN